MAVLLVRHACAGERTAWPATDRERPLDDTGRRQAAELVSLLRSFEPVRVCSSPATRCIQTVEPTAASLGLEVEVLEALNEGDSADAIELVRSLAGGETVVLCSHGDIVPDVLDALSVEGMAGWFGSHRCQKGSVWALHPNGATFEKAIYHPPPA
jgi:broad specificity phosphatase PhoE